MQFFFAPRGGTNIHIGSFLLSEEEYDEEHEEEDEEVEWKTGRLMIA